MSKAKPIGLAEFILQVKKDLLAQQISTQDPAPLFAISEVEVEVGVTATREAEGGLKAGINLAVIGLGSIEAGAGGTLSRENAQTVRIKLTPLLTREQLLDKLPAEDRQRIDDQARKVLLRGSEHTSTPDTA